MRVDDVASNLCMALIDGGYEPGAGLAGLREAVHWRVDVLGRPGHQQLQFADVHEPA